MSSYAAGTTVEVYASQLEVMKLLAKYGIKKHAFFSDGEESASIVFERDAISYRISIEMPDPQDEVYNFNGRGVKLSAADSAAKVAGECRRRWRCLVLIIKAKLVAVEDHVTTFEKEFMAYAVVDGDRTLADILVPRMQQAALNGKPLSTALALPGRSS